MSAFHERRIGRFFVSREAVDDNVSIFIYAAIEQPLEIKRDYFTDKICVVAACEDFDIVEMGHELPFYDFQLLGEMVSDRDITGVITGGHFEHQGVRWTKTPVCPECGAPHPLARSIMP